MLGPSQYNPRSMPNNPALLEETVTGHFWNIIRKGIELQLSMPSSSEKSGQTTQNTKTFSKQITPTVCKWCQSCGALGKFTQCSVELTIELWKGTFLSLYGKQHRATWMVIEGSGGS